MRHADAVTGTVRSNRPARRRTARRLAVMCCECREALEVGQRVRVEYIATASEARTALWRGKSFTGGAYHFPSCKKDGAR